MMISEIQQQKRQKISDIYFGPCLPRKVFQQNTSTTARERSFETVKMLRKTTLQVSMRKISSGNFDPHDNIRSYLSCIPCWLGFPGVFFLKDNRELFQSFFLTFVYPACILVKRILTIVSNMLLSVNINAQLALNVQHNAKLYSRKIIILHVL